MACLPYPPLLTLYPAPGASVRSHVLDVEQSRQREVLSGLRDGAVRSTYGTLRHGPSLAWWQASTNHLCQLTCGPTVRPDRLREVRSAERRRACVPHHRGAGYAESPSNINLCCMGGRAPEVAPAVWLQSCIGY